MLKKYESLNQIPAELTQAGGNTLRSEIHKPYLEKVRIATAAERVHYCA
jgi:hypothetical protein